MTKLMALLCYEIKW